MSVMAITVWAAAAHATPRLIFVLSRGSSATLLADSTARGHAVARRSSATCSAEPSTTRVMPGASFSFASGL